MPTLKCKSTFGAPHGKHPQASPLPHPRIRPLRRSNPVSLGGDNAIAAHTRLRRPPSVHCADQGRTDAFSPWSGVPDHRARCTHSCSEKEGVQGLLTRVLLVAHILPIQGSSSDELFCIQNPKNVLQSRRSSTAEDFHTSMPQSSPRLFLQPNPFKGVDSCKNASS